MLTDYRNLINTNYNISFQSRLPKVPKGYFRDIRAIPHLRCPICGKFMLTNGEIDAEIQSLNNPVYIRGKQLSVGRMAIRILKKYKSDLPEAYQEYIAIMDRYTKMFPDKSLKEIMQDERLNYYHNMMSYQLYCDYRKQKSEFIKNFNEFCSQLNEFERELLTRAHKERKANNIRGDFVELYMSFYEPVVAAIAKRDKKCAKQLEELIKSYPARNNNGHALWRIYHTKGLSDIDIVKRILKKKMNTFQHIVAACKNGGKEKENGIYMCFRCNNGLQFIKCSDIARIFPEFSKLVRSQISRIASFIKSEQLEGYDDYPILVKRTLKNKGGIKITIDSFLKDMKAILETRCSERSTRIEAIEVERASLKEKLVLLNNLKNNLCQKQDKENRLARKIEQIIKDKKTKKK